MKKVYMIRHGMPDFPDGKRMCLGTTDIPLGPEGLEQAKNMAAQLPAVTAVFSSPLLRAVQTAQAIGMPITILPDLREMDAGQWDGLTFEQIRLHYADLFAARGKDPTLPPPGAEDEEASLIRFRSAMEEAAQLSRGDFAVVSHGGIAARFLRSISGQWRKPAYAEVIVLTYHEGIFTMQNGPKQAVNKP